MLSLTDPAEVPAPVVNRSTAVLISIALHLLAVLLFVVAPEQVPQSVRAALRTWLAPILATPAAPEPPPVAAVEPPAAKQESIPLKFAYVKVPEEAEQRRNRDARLLSDRDRRARQEMPTPPGAQTRSLDPHSEGTSPDRVRPDPRIAAGQDSPDRPALPATPVSGTPEERAVATASQDRAVTTAGGKGAANGPTGSDRPSEAAETGADGGMAPARSAGDTPTTGPGATPAPGAGAGEAGTGGAGSGGADTGGVSSEPQRPGGPTTGGLPDLRSSEYKFQFSNPGWIRDPNYGTMSFDTQGFPWGDYARRVYVIIRNNWFERIPLAAREGIRGWACWHFVIGRDGTVSNLTLQRASGVPPFDRAASDALHASSRLPPLPADFPAPEEGVTYCFYYNIYPGETD